MIALDLRSIASFTEFFIIATGANQRQVQAIADEINEQLKTIIYAPRSHRGLQLGRLGLLDYGDFVVHIFNGESREFYDLARLWRDAGALRSRRTSKLQQQKPLPLNVRQLTSLQSKTI